MCFPLGRIVRKQVYSAKSGQIFKPLALIKVESCESIISYVLFIMALYLSTNAFEKLHSCTFFLRSWRLYAIVKRSGLTLAECQALTKVPLSLPPTTGQERENTVKGL